MHIYLLKGTISIAMQVGDTQIMLKEVVFTNYVRFTDSTSEINNTQTDNAKYIDVIMPMYNLI